MAAPESRFRFSPLGADEVLLIVVAATLVAVFVYYFVCGFRRGLVKARLRRLVEDDPGRLASEYARCLRLPELDVRCLLGELERDDAVLLLPESGDRRVWPRP